MTNKIKYNPVSNKNIFPQSARSEGESSGDQSCESSDEGVGRDAPTNHQPPLAPMHQPHPPHHNMNHHSTMNHQINNHQLNHTHQRNSPRPMERELKVRVAIFIAMTYSALVCLLFCSR